MTGSQISTTADIICLNRIDNPEKIYFLDGNQLIEYTT